MYCKILTKIETKISQEPNFKMIRVHQFGTISRNIRAQLAGGRNSKDAEKAGQR